MDRFGTEKELEGLIENQIPEGKFLEYKRDLPGTSQADHREFLADISSFANTAGGVLLLGVREEDGRAAELVGIERARVDSQTLRLENLLRDGVAPRIQGITIDNIELSSGRSVLAFTVPRTWNGPHMVTLGGSSRFFGRNTAGKHQLDVDQIRTAFIEGNSALERCRSFRTDRIFKILGGETPAPLGGTRPLILHVLSLGMGDPRLCPDMTGVMQDSSPVIALGQDHYRSRRINFDGVVTYWPNAYAQVFRTGAIETANGDLISPMETDLIASTLFEMELVRSLRRQFELTRSLRMVVPIVVMVSLLNVRGLRMAAPSNNYLPRRDTIDRDHLLLPEAIIEDTEQPAERVLQPFFDAVWNAAGWEASPNYAPTGEWRLANQL